MVWWWFGANVAGLRIINAFKFILQCFNSVTVNTDDQRWQTKQSETSTRVFVGKIAVTTYTCRYGHAPRIPRLVEQLFHKLPDPEKSS